MEHLEVRTLLSVTTGSNPDVLFSTANQNMWDAGAAQAIHADFSKTLIDADFGDSFGGYVAGTGFEASFSGGFDLGFSGEFNVTGGEVDVDYQTDVSIRALTRLGTPLTDGAGGVLSNLSAGESFILRSSASPDAGAVAMETRFASIDAGLSLDYGLHLDASLTGKVFDETVVSTGFSKSVSDSVELVSVSLDPGAQTAGLRLFGQDVDLGPVQSLYSSSEAKIEVEDPLFRILQVGLYAPQLNTGVPGDAYDDSVFYNLPSTAGQIVNTQLPVDRSQGRTRIDFFKAAVQLDRIVTAITGGALNSIVGNKYARVDASLITADLQAYLGIGQQMTFTPQLIVDYNFTDGDGNPVSVAVRPSGSRIYDAVTSISVPAGRDLEVIHPGGTLNIDTHYVLTGSFHNDTNLYLAPAFALDIGRIDVSGSLVPDFDFSLYSNTFTPDDPIEIGGLFDKTFNLGGFSQVDGADLSLTAGDPTTFTVVAVPESPATEGQDLVINGTIFDPTGATNGSDTYTLRISDWGDGRWANLPSGGQYYVPNSQTLTLDSGTTAANNGATFDPVSRTFSVSHHYVDELPGTPQFTLTATRTTNASQTDDMPVAFQVLNAAPQVRLDPLFLDNLGQATLTGSYTDPGVRDSQDVTIWWGDMVEVVTIMPPPMPPITQILSSYGKFALPVVGNLSVGQTFTSSNPTGTQTLRVTSVNATTGKVGFEVTGKTYGDLVVSEARVTVLDNDSGQGQASVQVPWGLGLTILGTSDLLIDEASAAAIDLTFHDEYYSEGDAYPNDPALAQYQLVVDWNDPNDPGNSTFDVTIGTAPSQGTWVIVTNTSGDDATATVLNKGVVASPTGDGWRFTIAPQIRISRPYADDGQAPGNGTSSDATTAVVNIYQTDRPQGGAANTPVIVSDVAPTVTLHPTDQVGFGGVAVLNGTVADPGLLDAVRLRVNWGDGSISDNVAMSPVQDGLQEFHVSHVYTTDLDGGSYNVTVTASDDDNRSGTATTAFVVDLDRPPVAVDDRFSQVFANKVYQLNVLADNTPGDEDPQTIDVDPEGFLDPSATALVPDSLVWHLPDVGAFPLPESMLTNNHDGTFTFDPRTEFAWLPKDQGVYVEFDYQIADTTGNTDTANVRMYVIGVNHPPVITSPAAADVDENSTAVLTVTATDADLPAQTLIFSISGGADRDLFTIDAATGELAFAAAPNYEAPADADGDNVYNVQVRADDQNGLTTTQDIAVSVLPVNDNAPAITSPAAVDVDENATAVLIVTATDADLPAQTVIFSITGGADASKFTIDAGTGVLAFATAPDYEAPTDSGGDNVYDVQVQADDQNGLTSTQDIAVSVQPVNDNTPVITSATTAEVVENSTDVLTVTATDADLPTQTVTFSVSGGPDGAHFVMDAATGALAFVSAPDYETPLDADGDNVYEVEVTANDDNGLRSTQAIQVTVLNQASITGAVFVDTDQNGLYDANEMGIDGVTVELLDAASGAVLQTVTTSAGGYYQFEDYEPGTYRIREVQPTGVSDGAEHVGSLGGTIVANDVMEVTLERTDGSDYDFGEIGLPVTSGDTATIGFWQNKHGQALITAGGAALADWLTANFGNIFGNTFVGADGDDVAAFYKDQLFKQMGAKSVAGPAKVDAQFMAVAFATYFTDVDLAGNVAAGYGFNVTDTGIGTRIVNVGDSGAAFGVANATDLAIMQLLLAVNDLTDRPDAQDGFASIYDRDGNGVIDRAEAQLRSLADAVFSSLNENGHI